MQDNIATVLYQKDTVGTLSHALRVGACLAIDDRYEVWESGYISIPFDFQLSDLRPRLQKLLSAPPAQASASLQDLDTKGQLSESPISPEMPLDSCKSAESHIQQFESLHIGMSRSLGASRPVSCSTQSMNHQNLQVKYCSRSKAVSSVEQRYPRKLFLAITCTTIHPRRSMSCVQQNLRHRFCKPVDFLGAAYKAC